MRRGPSIGKQRGAISRLLVSPLQGYNWAFLSQELLTSEYEALPWRDLRPLYEECQSFAIARMSLEKWRSLYCIYTQLGGGSHKVLSLMAQNLNIQEIADVLGKKRRTIDLHVSILKTAFGARSREFLVLLLAISGIIVLPEEAILRKASLENKGEDAIPQPSFSLLAEYSWEQLQYSRLSAHEEGLLKERLKRVYENRCDSLPLMSSQISFDNWYALYRVYMQIGDGKRRVLSLMTQNLTTQEIADQLGRNKGTINNHISELRTAFGAKSREFLILLLAVSGIFVFNREGVRDAAA